MTTFGDRVVSAVKKKGNPCVVGLDFHDRLIPAFVSKALQQCKARDEFRRIVSELFCRIIEAVSPLVPAIKPQYSLLESYGAAGVEILEDIIRVAHNEDLLVIADAKRGDIASSAKGYADAFLSARSTELFPHGYDADALTVNAFLGRDTLDPYIDICKQSTKGIFVLVKTSNSGSAETQDARLESGKSIAELYAEIVDQVGHKCIGDSGYSGVGAVVGATFPLEASKLRKLMPHAIVLVPGYGTQGASAKDVVVNFNDDGLGALVNSSRSITYAYGSTDVSEKNYYLSVVENTNRMIDDIVHALKTVSG
jgi:orotidine-5'-phosphate decarboxylase